MKKIIFLITITVSLTLLSTGCNHDIDCVDNYITSEDSIHYNDNTDNAKENVSRPIQEVCIPCDSNAGIDNF